MATPPVLVREPVSRPSIEIAPESLPSTVTVPALVMLPIAPGASTRMPNRAEPWAKGPSRSPSLSVSVAV